MAVLDGISRRVLSKRLFRSHKTEISVVEILWLEIFRFSVYY